MVSCTFAVKPASPAPAKSMKKTHPYDEHGGKATAETVLHAVLSTLTAYILLAPSRLPGEGAAVLAPA